MNAFTFIPRKNHKNHPNKLIVTKFIRRTLPMFNNKAFLEFIDKTSWRIDNKNKKHKKQRDSNPQKYFWPYFFFPTESAKWKAFYQLEKHINYKVFN